MTLQVVHYDGNRLVHFKEIRQYKDEVKLKQILFRTGVSRDGFHKNRVEYNKQSNFIRLKEAIFSKYFTLSLETVYHDLIRNYILKDTKNVQKVLCPRKQLRLKIRNLI